MVKKQTVDITNSKIAGREKYTGVLEKISSNDICPFCEKNISQFHTKPILFKNKLWIATTNAWPYPGAKKHFLLISRVHTPSIEAGPVELGKELFAAYRKIVRDFKLEGATLFIRSGETSYTGATVSHLHAQVVSGVKRTPKTEFLTVVVGNKKK